MGTLALLAALAPRSLPLLGAPAAPDAFAGKPALADASGSAWGVDYLAQGGGVVDAIRVGQPPRGWGPNCYGEVDPALQWEAASGRAGGAALSLDCRAFRGGRFNRWL